MLKVETQESRDFDVLSVAQYGRDIQVAQLTPGEKASCVSLYQTPHVGYLKFHYGPAYDQRIYVKKGFIGFGFLDANNPATYTYDSLVPNDAIFVYPRDGVMRACAPAGFRGSSIHISEDFLQKVAEQLYQRPLEMLVPMSGIFRLNGALLRALRTELRKWQDMQLYGAGERASIVARREESLAAALIYGVAERQKIDTGGLIKSERVFRKTLDLIHSSELDNISAAELATHAGCSQRLLEKSFLKRFGVTPKKYIKSLRLARVHRGLQNFEAQDCDSIIELAGIQGFWHMGQFAADYRRIYGELPSDTLRKN